MSNSDIEVCVLCGEVGHIGVDCEANICILCLETGHRFSQCGEDQEGKEPEISDVVEIVFDDFEEKYIFKKKMEDLLCKWEKSTSKTILQTFKEDFCGLCFISFPSVDIALLHYKGSIHNMSMQDQIENKHPVFWKMVLRAVELKEPAGAHKQDIFQIMVEKYEVNKFLSTHDIYQMIKEILIDMEGKYNCLIKDGGRYRLRTKVSWEKELVRFSQENMRNNVGERTCSKKMKVVRTRDDSIEHIKYSRRREEDQDYRSSSKRHQHSPPHNQSQYHQPLPTPPHSGAGSITPPCQRNFAFTPTHSFPSPSPSPESWTRREGRRSRS